MQTKFIAEIGSNHCRSLSRTLTLIKEAKRIGCYAVKFQYFRANRLYAPEFKSKVTQMEEWELPGGFIPEIESCCIDLDIKFGCSVFDVESVEAIASWVNYLKIGSYELLYTDLIKAVIKANKPWMLSCGLATPISKVSEVLNKTTKRKEDLPKVVFHCNSNYPAKPKDCNLDQIRVLKWRLTRIISPSPKIGWSDHTMEPGVLHKAIALGAEYIEFHFDLEDGKGYESTIGHCWKPHQIGSVIRDVRIGEMAEEGTGTGESEAAKWRTDPTDGMRPLREFRKELLENEIEE